ncbi:hypothetical protein SCHPADRAFT_191428 [Schizopora paradoxa]|uniref:Uncharacterized protein n=1 Tax=Schizopora paradoxa TaxID=27342 RepID=A0A0H2SIR2_9AGAM|nr:hypothetical protein SCHPADRAFT_191428 [Schizopora paradoxa]
MSTLTRDQIRHEVINLRKTVKLLERTVDEEDWTTSTQPDRLPKWLKTQTVLKGVKHCRSVLKTIPPEVYDEGLGAQRAVSGEQFHEDTIQTLNRLELSMKDASLEFKPQPVKPKPRLPLLPIPKSLLKTEEAAAPIEAHASEEEETLDPAGTGETSVDKSPGRKPIFDIIPDTLPTADKSSALLPPSFPSISSPPAVPNSTSTSAFLQSSTALHDELAEQMASMARQLKENTIHFSSSLAKDKGVMQEVEEKLERNAEVLGKERVRLRDHRGKSGNTTWITILSLLVVMVGFFMTFFVIRIS